MKRISDGGRDLLLKHLADDGAKQRFEKPGEPGEFGFAERVGEVVDVDADGLERQHLLERLLGDVDIERDVDAAVVELEGRDAFVRQTQEAGVGAQPEADFFGAQGEAVDFDGEVRGCGGGGAVGGFADFEVVVGFEAELVGEEGGVVYGPARFDDEVFEEEVEFGDGDFEAGDGDVLDRLDEEGDDDVDAVAYEVFVCGGGGRGEDGDDFASGGDELRDVWVREGGVEGFLGLGQEVVDVSADGGVGTD